MPCSISWHYDILQVFNCLCGSSTVCLSVSGPGSDGMLQPLHGLYRQIYPLMESIQGSNCPQG